MGVSSTESHGLVEPDHGASRLAEIRAGLQASKRSFAFGVMLLLTLSLLSVVGATGVGRLQFPWKIVMAAIGEGLGLAPPGTVERMPLVVIFGIRLSRVVLSFLVGSALGVA